VEAKVRHFRLDHSASANANFHVFSMWLRKGVITRIATVRNHMQRTITNNAALMWKTVEKRAVSLAVGGIFPRNSLDRTIQ
jgi:hypothetical protein